MLGKVTVNFIRLINTEKPWFEYDFSPCRFSYLLYLFICGDFSMGGVGGRKGIITELIFKDK